MIQEYKNFIKWHVQNPLRKIPGSAVQYIRDLSSPRSDVVPGEPSLTRREEEQHSGSPGDAGSQPVITHPAVSMYQIQVGGTPSLMGTNALLVWYTCNATC